MEQKLKGEVRTETGKGASRRIRALGRVPAVLYGHGMDPLPLSVDALDLFHVLHTEAGMNVLIDLEVDGAKHLALARELQRDNTKGRLVHVDFLAIRKDQRITVQVPIRLVGESHGVKEGGVLEHHLWELEIECLPTDVPEGIDVDISGIGVNENLHVSDVEIPGDLVLKTPEDEIVVAVVPPQKAEPEPTEALAEGEEAPAEGEEGAEPAEGAAAGESGESQEGGGD